MECVWFGSEQKATRTWSAHNEEKEKRKIATLWPNGTHKTRGSWMMKKTRLDWTSKAHFGVRASLRSSRVPGSLIYRTFLMVFDLGRHGRLIVSVYLWCQRSASWVDESAQRHGACHTLKISSVALPDINMSLSTWQIYCTRFRTLQTAFKLASVTFKALFKKKKKLEQFLKEKQNQMDSCL